MKRNMRKGLCIVIASILMLGTLAACGGNAGSPKGSGGSGAQAKKVIRVCWWGNQTRNDGTVKALNMYKEKHADVDFEVEFSDWDGYWDKLATQAAGGNMADIIQMDYAYLKQYQEQKQVMGLQKYIDSGVIDTKNISENVMNSGRIGEDIYGIVSGIGCKALLVNTDAMKEANVTLPEQPTYEELFDAAKKVLKATGMQISIPSNDEQSMLFLARAVGQTMYNTAGDGLGMPDDKVALRYYQILADTLKEGVHVSPEIMAESSTNQQSLFAAKKVWVQFMNSNQITNEINQCDKSIHYDILMYPTEKNASQQPLFTKPAMFYSVAGDSKSADAAAAVINFLTNSVEANTKALKGERGVPISSEVSKAIEPVVDEVTAKVDTYVGKITEVATPIDPPFPAASAEIGKNISDLADGVRFGKISPKDAAAEFYKKSTELLKKGVKS